MRKQLLTSTAAGVIAGAVIFNAAPARAAGYPVFDWAVQFAIQTAQKAMTNAITAVQNEITNVGNIFNTGIAALGTQNANYSKASISAQEKIADANNTIMARNARDLRNAQLRDEHVLTPQACISLDDGQSIAVSAGQSWRVSQGIDLEIDKRTQGRPGSPAWAGEGQALAAANQLHLSRYCSENEKAAGLCGNVADTTENADQASESLLGSGSYPDQTAIDTANDYARTLIEPVPPGALRGAQLASVAGQDASARRRGYTAQISLANGVINDIIASRTSSVVLTSTQKAQMTAQGITPTDTASWFMAEDLEVNRRISNVDWHASLQGMPPKSVLVEIATEMAMNNYIVWQNYRMAQQSAALLAAQLAATATSNLRSTPAPAIPTPQMASQ